MPANISCIVLALFVPADRHDRVLKAAATGADAVILDLEDAVAADAKASARAGLPDVVRAESGLLLRINAAGTCWHDEDVAMAARLPLAAVMLAKTETADQARHVAQATGHPVIALVESARGIANATSIADAAVRLAFGSIDYAADLAMAHTRPALNHARASLVLASRLAGLPAPIDGVTTAIRDDDTVCDDSRHSVEMGFGGKLLIHPAQIAPARRGFAPAVHEIAWAQRVFAAAQGDAVFMLDGTMVDPPVILRARQVLARTSPPLVDCF